MSGASAVEVCCTVGVLVMLQPRRSPSMDWLTKIDPRIAQVEDKQLGERTSRLSIRPCVNQ